MGIYSSSIKPIFLISLPRSGSTFLQKILMSHPDVASTGEPWFLLPLCHMSRKEGVFANYGHIQSVNALNRISSGSTNGLVDHAIAGYAESIYTKFCTNNERYFLDKTPRYYFILDDLIRVFPGAKFVVLLRNPVSVFASSIEAFRGNTMRRLDHLSCDFTSGPKLIGDFVERHKDRVITLNYEALVTNTPEKVSDVCSYLGLNFSEKMIAQSFNVELEGHGDHLGAKAYKSVQANEGKWKKLITTSCRKQRLIRYLKQCPEAYLAAGGYDRCKLIKSVENHRVSSLNLLEYVAWLEEVLVRAYKSPMRGRNV